MRTDKQVNVFNYTILTFVFAGIYFKFLTHVEKKSHTLRFVAVTHRPINRPSY